MIYEKLCSAILGAARKSIPRTNGKQKFRPYWNKSLKELVKLRKKARKKAAKLKTPEARRAYNKLTAEIRDTV